MIELVIMSRGRSHHLEKSLASLHSQNLPKSKWSYRICENPNGINREKEILESSADWILFLDEDCSLPDACFLERFQKLTHDFPEVQVWGGLYLTEKKSAYSVKAYNELCNSWVLLSDQKVRTGNLLGGSMALHVPSVKPYLKENPIHWGGEETFLLRVLQKNGMTCRHTPELNVIHHPDPQTLQTLWKRGAAHGKSRKQFQLETSRYSSQGVSYALKQFAYWPVWALHFASLAKEVAVQKTVPKDKLLQ